MSEAGRIQKENNFVILQESKLQCRDSYGMTKVKIKIFSNFQMLKSEMNKKSLSKFQTEKGVKKKILRTFLILEVFFFVSNAKRGEAHPGLNGALFFFVQTSGIRKREEKKAGVEDGLRCPNH